MSRKNKIIIGAVALAVMLGGAVAYAQWTGNATGSGRARATTNVAGTVNPADGTADLYPGFTGGDVYFTVENPNPYPITYTDMTAGTVTSSDETACPASNVTVTSPVTDLTLASPPGTSDQLSIPDIVSMDAAAPDGCQGIAFDIELTLTGSQSAG